MTQQLTGIRSRLPLLVAGMMFTVAGNAGTIAPGYGTELLWQNPSTGSS